MAPDAREAHRVSKEKNLMRTALAALTATALLVPTAIALGVGADPPLPAGEHARLIVGFHAPPDADATDYEGAKVVGVDLDLAYYVVETSNAAAFRARTMTDPHVRYVESDLSDHKLLFTPNDYFWNHASNWGVKKIGAETAWDATTGATTVKVAMIDSGINRIHEEYAGQSRVLTGKNYYQTTKPADDNSGCSFHGTHTTGIAGATINNGKGFAGLSQHTILPVKIFGGGRCLAASTSNIANAIKYAADQGAHLSSNSWGGGAYSTAINDAITYAHNKGTVHVAAAGNDGPCTSCIGNPWKPQASRTIIVTASTSADAFASFSSEGAETDVIAPGDYIGSSTGSTATSYHIMSGTSQATPHVTGVLALVKALNPTFGYNELEARVKGTAVNLGLPAEKQGSGRLNAAGAVY